jgi:hypothetical protein
MLLQPQENLAPHFRRLRFQLDCGRQVSLEGCCILPSTRGYLEGGKDVIRDAVIERVPKVARAKFPGENCGFFLKPVADGERPVYTFIVDLVCHEPLCDPDADTSSLVVSWMSNDINVNLPELIDREISSVE